MMIVRTLVVGPIETCCYVVGCEQTKDGMIVDPGAEADLIAQVVREEELTPLYLVNTHGHGDHMGGNERLKKQFPDMQICIHPQDAPMLPDASKNLSAFFGLPYDSPPADRLIQDGDFIEVGQYRFRVIHLPGHTRGHIVLLWRPEHSSAGPPVVFAGDTLFHMGIGRSDLPGGWHTGLIKGIKEKLLILPDETIVYPGHGPQTTIGAEKAHNPWLV